ncbi:MAG: hypothetical protein HQL71_11525 [Magnetococcales bacterium]|nr:hypothetical protein [Magnetococcales bacterium]
MGSAILHFILLNAVVITIASAVVSLVFFAILHRSGKGGAAAVFALVSSLLYVAIPFFGGYLTIIAGIMAYYVRGNYLWMAIGTIVVNILNVLMLSPILRANATGAVQAGDYKWAILFISLAVVQVIIGLVVFYRFIEHKKDEALEEPFDFTDEDEINALSKSY